MTLAKRLEQTGEVFFRYRSHIPFVLVALLILDYRNYHYFAGDKFYDGIYTIFCFCVSLLGFFLRVATVGYSRSGTSGRNTRSQLANSLNTDGLYSVVRNPIYAGNFFIALGVVMLSQSIGLVAISVLVIFCFYLPVIIREEAFLAKSFPQEFAKFTETVPALVPNFKSWKKPQLKFNVIRVLYREPDVAWGIVSGFFIMSVFRASVIEKKFVFDGAWTAVFLVLFAVGCVLKSFKKKLKNLDSSRGNP